MNKQAKNNNLVVKPNVKGRPKGSPNKTTAAITEMIEAALDKAGGVDYLVMQSIDNPTAFMGLIGKVLPMQVTGDMNVKFTGLKVKIVGTDD